VTIKQEEGIELPSPVETLTWWVKNKNKICGAVLVLIGFFGGNADRVVEIARDIIPDLSTKDDSQGDSDDSNQNIPAIPIPEPEELSEMRSQVEDNASNINDLQIKQEALIDDIGDFGTKVDELKDKVELLDLDEEDEETNGQIPIE